jgi:tryptophanyl-tRNA synthetase
MVRYDAYPDAGGRLSWSLALLDDTGELDAVLARGAEKARAVAATTLARVYDRVGFLAAR